MANQTGKRGGQRLTNRTTVREIIIQRAIDNLTWQEIADAHGVSVRALQDLRKRDSWIEISREVEREIEAEIAPRLRQRVLELMESGDHKAAVQACRLAYERLLGMPEQRVKADISVRGDLSGLTNAELAAIADGSKPSEDDGEDDDETER